MTEFYENEKIEYSLAVDLRKGIDYISGALTITDKRFIFVPHKIHMRKGIVEFNTSDIANIDSSEILGIVPNGVTVDLTDGSSYTFVVESHSVVTCEDIIETVWSLMEP